MKLIVISFWLLTVVALTSCKATFTVTEEQPVVGGNYADKGGCAATIKIGRKATKIIDYDAETIRVVPADSVSVDGETVTITYTDRIKVIYYGYGRFQH
jgi:hypothetical protein